MSGVLKIEMAESEETLRKLLAQLKSAQLAERVQVLYWLKTRQAESVGHLASLLGHHRTTVSRWLSQYHQGGLKALLDIKSSSGRPPSIPPFVRERLKEELKDPEGFSSYGEIQTWLEAVCGVKASYKVVHETVRYRLKGKLKVPRPVSVKQSEGAVETFKKKLGEQLTNLLKKNMD